MRLLIPEQHCQHERIGQRITRSCTAKINKNFDIFTPTKQESSDRLDFLYITSLHPISRESQF